MAKKRRHSAAKKKINRIRRGGANFFNPSKTKTLEQYIIANAMTGMFTAAGAVIGTILAKYLLKEAEKFVPVPESLHTMINNE